ncbi:MAG: DOMON-like domain-containing protein [Rhodoplanes sp.]|uniref:DOMON-like domain-containing protein n=1 Tax=Rhodoplanes sp. TaxID=1968906 RepID=UPI00180FD532|nr:DOMON-like domain-containing protein [Rhodoplanes sp.]NVO15764.1 DOMON-like domain-containing protein [Rhodoplanes sp.]
MLLPLRRHPDSPNAAATDVTVEVARPAAGRLLLTWIVTGAITAIRIPPPETPARADELWRHTCFEAFVRAPPGSAYYEFNFSPSTCWAAYRFDFYRSGMRVADEIGAPLIEAQSRADGWVLQAALELDRLSALPCDAPLHLGLSAVIEDTNGRLSYWALAHPPGKPDFHHADGFAHDLLPA